MIETERLVLRPFRESDAEDVPEYLRSPAVHCFYCMKLDSLEAARDEMKKRAADNILVRNLCAGDRDCAHRTELPKQIRSDHQYPRRVRACRRAARC